jgi:3-hydroxy-9,10-secoandrosta-1,3,5(10)-triene-9,17-dione monooxygenase
MTLNILQTPTSAADWADWAEAFSGRLAERAQEAEAARRLPAATLEEVQAARFFGMLVPPSLGGQGASFASFLDVVRRLGAGCASSAWTLSFLALHAWLLCKFEPELQAELFRDGAMPLAPAPLAPTGKAVKADGGYRVSGRWEWATGVNHAGWAIVSCVEPDAFGPRFCVLPLSDLKVEDVWRVSGMAATGSNTLVADDVFVPIHRTIAAVHMKLTASPGQALHPGTTVDYPMSTTLGLVASTPALGAAEGALAAFTQRMRSKMQAYSGAKQAELPVTHMRLGQAMATVRSARLVWEDAIRLLERDGPLGHETPLDTLVAVRLASADVVRLSNEAVNGLAAAAGASSGFLNMPLQRQLRDLQMMRGHVMFDWDRAAQVAGKIALGLQPDVTDLL